MRLILQLSSPTPDVERTHVFTEAGGTIGRDDDNSWVLRHPKVSAHHAVISFSDGQFFIEDTSDLGVVVNYVREIGPRPYALKVGDRLFIEPYEIEVELDTEDERASLDFEHAPFALPSDPGAELREPAPSSSEAGELDPLVFLKPEAGSPKPSPPATRPVDDLLSEHYAPPTSVSPPPASTGELDAEPIPAGYNPLDDEPCGPSISSPPPMEDALRRHEEEQRRRAEAERQRREEEEQVRHETEAERQRRQEAHERLRQEKVREVLARAKKAFREHEYGVAIRAAEKALELDPLLSEARALQEAVEKGIREAEEERAILQRAAEAERSREREEQTGQWKVPELQTASASEPNTEILVPESSARYKRLSPGLWSRLKDFFTPTWSTYSAPVPERRANLDTVNCTVYAPPQVARGSAFLIQVFAHTPNDERSARRLAAVYDTAAKPRGKTSLKHRLPRGIELTFVLSASGFTFQEPVQRLVWNGTPESVQFEIAVPTDFSAETFIGTVSIVDGTIPIGRVRFVVRIASAKVAVARNEVLPDQSWTRYRHAFVSYAAEDRVEVLKRVQMLERVKIDFFQDVLSLEPGERWARALYKNIERSDVFLLFWSSNAKKSKWVLREVRYAMDLHRGDDLAPPEIVPVIIEGPPPVAPPPELKGLHFNDRFLYFIAGS